MIEHYDRQGNPITFEEYCNKTEDPEYKIIIQTTVPETDIWISTVWLGLDHNFGERGDPVIFETMVFGGQYDQWQERYCTEAEAREWHWKIVEMVTGHAIVLDQQVLQEMENAAPDVQREPTDPRGR